MHKHIFTLGHALPPIIRSMKLDSANFPQQNLAEQNNLFLIQKSTFDDWKQIVDLSTETQGWAMAYEDFCVWEKAFGEQYAELLVAKRKEGRYSQLIVSFHTFEVSHFYFHNVIDIKISRIV